MKTNLFKAMTLAFITLMIISCTKEESSSSTTTTISATGVKLTAQTANGELKEDYIIMMFATRPALNEVLPPIIKQVRTNENGLAFFDLNAVITSTIEKTYYFEAFVDIEGDYLWTSITHPSFDIKKGNMHTSSILVN